VPGNEWENLFLIYMPFMIRKKIALTVLGFLIFLRAFPWGNDINIHTEPVGRTSIVATSSGKLYCSVPSGITGQRGINILQSTDLGASWSLVVNLSNGQLVAKSKLVVTGTDSVYCAYQQGSSLYFYSLQSHRRFTYSAHSISDFDIAASPNENSIYLFVDEASTDYLFYATSIDGGSTWTGSHGTVSVNAAQPRVTMDGTRLILNYYGPVLSNLITSDIRMMIFDEGGAGIIVPGGFYSLVASGIERPQFQSVIQNGNVWFVFSENDTVQLIKYKLSTNNGSTYGPETVLAGNAISNTGCFDIAGYKNQSDSGMYLVYFFEMFPAQAEMKFTSVMTSSPNSFSPEENFNDFTAVCTDDDTYPAVCPILSDVGVVIFETNAAVSSLYYDIRTTLLKTDEVKPAAAIKLYPNPSKDYLHIELMQAPTSQTILIRNYTGRIVKEFSITNEKATLDITDLSQGVYWLQDQNGGSYRFLKM